MQPLFQVWSHRRRKDSTGRVDQSVHEQPRQVGKWLFLGDLDDALSLTKLTDRNIGAVLCLCEDRVGPGAFDPVLAHGVEVSTLPATDATNFDILAITWPAAERILQAWETAGVQNVLVVCWGGVNRSGAIVGAWLRMHEDHSFTAMMSALTQARGTVLTNLAFRRALLTHPSL